MTKICKKCGRELAHEDFLCPHCGAIWGEPVRSAWQPPAQPQPEPTVSRKEDPKLQEPAAKQLPKPSKKKNWLVPVMALVLTLFLLGLLLWSLGQGDGVGEPGTQPSTTAVPTTLPPTEPPTFPPSEPYITYTLRVVDVDGKPVPNVQFHKPYMEYMGGIDLPVYPGDLIGGGIIQTRYLVTDESGMVTFTLNRRLLAYYFILSVPDGYSDALVGVQKFFQPGQREMVIVLPYAE